MLRIAQCTGIWKCSTVQSFTPQITTIKPSIAKVIPFHHVIMKHDSRWASTVDALDLVWHHHVTSSHIDQCQITRPGIITPEAYEGIWKANSLLLHWLQWPGTKALSAFHPAGCVCTDGWDGWDYFRARSSAPLTLSFHDMLLLTLWSWQNTQLNIMTNIINKKKVDMHTFTGIMNFRFFSIHFDARNE